MQSPEPAQPVNHRLSPLKQWIPAAVVSLLAFSNERVVGHPEVDPKAQAPFEEVWPHEERQVGLRRLSANQSTTDSIGPSAELLVPGCTNGNHMPPAPPRGARHQSR